MADTPHTPETPKPNDKPEATASFEEHRQGIIGEVARKFIAEMHFRNILAVMVVSTLCAKEIQGLPVGSEFYMLAGLVLGLYFQAGDKKK
jgi:hypothetical protein